MTGSFVVGDTFNASIRRVAHEQLGPIDEIVATNGVDGVRRLSETFAGYTDANVDGVLAVTRASASASSVGDAAGAPRRAAPKAQLLETDFAAARTFGGDEDATGIDGPTPLPGEAAIGTDLAPTLHAAAGDEIEVFAYGGSTRLRVVRVLPQRGVAGYWEGDETASRNVFVAPGTIAGLVARGDAAVAAPPRSLLFISNRGGVEDGVVHTDAVERSLRDRIGSEPFSVTAEKQRVLDRAERTGNSFSQLYSSLGLFAVLAGILLLVNIFFMLADERKSELGMLRAVGLRRGSLIGAFATEGWCYAVASAIAGTFVGLLLGRLLMAAASELRGDDESRVSLHFSFEWSSVQRGLVIGFVIAVATVLTTSIWLSRFNIIRAIRDITETPRRRPRRRSSYIGLFAAVVGLLLTGVGVGGASFFALLCGPALVFVGIAPTLARNLNRVAVTTAIAVIVLAWAVIAVPISLALDADIDVLLFVLQGLVLVASAVVLVSQHQEAIGHALGRLANRSLRVRLGLAYPLARRFRTAMTLGMFALVVFILVMVSVFSAMFSGQLNRFIREASGGYDVVVESNPTNPVDFTSLAREPGVRALSPLVTAGTRVMSAPGLERPRQWLITGFDRGFVDQGPPALDDRGGYPNDEAVYRAILADPTLVIVDEFFLAGGAGPPNQAVDIGDRFVVQDEGSGATREFTVAAISTVDVAPNGILASSEATDALLGPRAVPNRAYAAVDNPTQFAETFAGRFLVNGGEAETLAAIVERELEQQQQFFLLMRGYLALGLIVGIAGIGVIMVRAVRERRRQVGVLRALGFQAAAVRSAFVVESAFVAVEGVIIGTALALVCTWSITLTDAFGDGMSFRVPFGAIGVLMLGTLLFALVATAAPARAAAKIEPAVALRIAD
jgi:putative ABC transport system permease protein